MHARVLRYLDEVVRRGSIRKAAEYLHIAPTAVNRQILELESELGAPLFDRIHKRLRLTPLGEMVLDGRAVTVCPQTGGTIVRSGAGGLRIALDVPGLALTGRLGETPLRIQSGPVGFAWPGTVTARAVDVALQRRGIPSQFLTFPDENHWVLKPHNSVLWHDTVNAWLKQWTAAPKQ